MPVAAIEKQSSSKIKRPERLLFVVYYEARSVPSIWSNIKFIAQNSAFKIDVLNLAEHMLESGLYKIPAAVRLGKYQGIIVHNTVSYNVDTLKALDDLVAEKFETYQGAKIVFKQDEHYRFSEFVTVAQAQGVDCIFSLMPEQELPTTYGRFLPKVRIEPMLAGYVTKEMRHGYDARAPRSIDLGYRGSIMPLSFGRLCYQKRRIGEEVSHRLRDSGLRLDISSRWQDRLGGEEWIRFLHNCTGVLGIESGPSLFDLDGQLELRVKEVEEELGPSDGSDEYAEAFLARFAHLERQVAYTTIAPRHFEAIAAGALQILFPGRYADRMSAGRHYFELREDYSNLDDAIALLRDDAARSKLVACAFEEVVLDPRNWIETFVSSFDETVRQIVEAKGASPKPSFSSGGEAVNVLQIQLDGYGLDPRRDSWYSSGAPRGVNIHKAGIDRAASAPRLVASPRGELVVDLPLLKWDQGLANSLFQVTASDDGASIALRELVALAETLTVDDAELFVRFGVPQQPIPLAQFRAYLRYVLDSSATLIDYGLRTHGTHAIVAANFPSVLAGLVLKGALEVPLVYEALEYWPESNPDWGEYTQSFWVAMERRLLPYVDHRGTVSPHLARVMAGVLGVPFYSVPNCPPVSSAVRARGTSALESVRFLYQGGFAPHRGIELLIEAWPQVDARAVLLLRGPDNEFKAKMHRLAESTGLLDDRIFFPVPVAVEELIDAAHCDGDVGLIPYSPVGANYENCSPNKLGQYLAAGLPVLANETHFVSEVVRTSKAGLAVNLRRAPDLRAAVELLCDPLFRSKCGEAASRYFAEQFNWEAVSGPYYEAIRAATADCIPCVFSVRPNPVEAAAPVACAIEVEPQPEPRLGYQIARSVWRGLPASLRHRLARGMGI